MFRIVSLITSLKQHLDYLASNLKSYRPPACPHCGFGRLWGHGCYERKADRSLPSGDSLNPIPIPRFLCTGCRHTCSRLPECIAPRRWYDWALQQVVFLMLLKGSSRYQCSQVCGVTRSTVGRWWNELCERTQEFELFLRSRFPELGRTVNFEDFWQRCLQIMPLSRAMAFLDQDGVVVP